MLAGITEPAIYGITLKYKKPFYIGAAFSGIAGAIVAACGAGASALIGTSLLTLPGYIGQGFVGFLIACAIAYFGSAIVTYLFGFNDDMILTLAKQAKTEEKEITENFVKNVEIKMPVNGKVIPLSQVKDEAFASEALGKGVAIIPDNGRICAPCDGVISAMYPTGHAIGITSENGAEVLIYVGMDTVTLGGKGFKVTVSEGQRVKSGDLLIKVNFDHIRASGLDITTPIVIVNTADYAEVKAVAAEKAFLGDTILNCISR